MADNAKPRGRPARRSPVNEDTHKVEATPLSPSARPAKAERPARRRPKGSVGGHRNILNVQPRDANFLNEYTLRWVIDADEGGHHVLHYYTMDWEFVRADEVTVGETFVYKTRGAESIVRIPAGGNVDASKWMFLMKKFRDWHEDDQREAQKELDQQEAHMLRRRDPSRPETVGDGLGAVEGLYGEGKSSWN